MRKVLVILGICLLIPSIGYGIDKSLVNSYYSKYKEYDCDFRIGEDSSFQFGCYKNDTPKGINRFGTYVTSKMKVKQNGNNLLIQDKGKTLGNIIKNGDYYTLKFNKDVVNQIFGDSEQHKDNDTKNYQKLLSNPNEFNKWSNMISSMKFKGYVPETNVWKMGDGLHFIHNTNLGKDSQVVFGIDYCITPEKRYCENKVYFEVYCGENKNGEPIYSSVVMNGNPKIVNDNTLVIKTNDGSEFILKDMTKVKEDIEYGGLVVDLESRLSNNFNLRWNNNICRKGIDYVSKNYKKIVSNLKLESYRGD